MDDFDNFDCHDGYPYSPSHCAPVADHFAESYNYCTIDPVAIMLRHQREEHERHMLEVEPGQTWTHDAPNHTTFEVEPDQTWAPEVSNYTGYAAVSAYEATSDKAFRIAAAEYALLRADDPDAPHEALAAAAAGHKYYYLPDEPISWRRPLRCPNGGYDAFWSKMFCHADERSMYLAEQLSYIGARDDDGWIRPTRWELFRMGFWTAQRYAFYYAEFAEEFGRKIPLWVEFLRPLRAHPPSAEFWA